jgi:hypothetical protein
MCLRLGRFGMNPIAVYHLMPVADLMDWGPAIDHQEADDTMQLARAVAMGGGNMTEDGHQQLSDEIAAKRISLPPLPRTSTESPF